MEIAMKDGLLYMRNMDSTQYNVIRGVRSVKWDKKRQMLIGPAELELLRCLGSIITLPTKVEAERVRLESIQNDIDRIRMEDSPEELVHYPVKAKLFSHQIKAANMALLAFNAIDPLQNGS